MLTTRLPMALGCMVLNLNLTMCRSPGEPEKSPPPPASQAKVVEVPGVDTSDLTPREKSEWTSLVNELTSPCPGKTMSVAVCAEQKACAACVPAASYVKSQVRRGLTSGQVEAAYDARFGIEGVHSFDLASSPSKGAPDASVTLVEFADFECPACRAVSPLLDQVVKEVPGVRLVFMNYPLPMHQNAELAARAATAAGLQGKFWEMHGALFGTEPPLAPERITQLAKGIGLDMTKFEADLRSEAVADRVRAERKAGEGAKIQATPSIFVNGRAFDYSDDLKRELSEWIQLDQELLGAKAPK